MNRIDELVGSRVRVLPGVGILGHRPWPLGSFDECLTSLTPGTFGEITEAVTHGIAPYTRYHVRLDDWTCMVNANLGRDVEVIEGRRSTADLAVMAVTARTVYDLSEPMLAALRASWRPGMTTDWRPPVLRAPECIVEQLEQRSLACRWRAGTSDPGVVRLTRAGMTLAVTLHAADLHEGREPR